MTTDSPGHNKACRLVELLGLSLVPNAMIESIVGQFREQMGSDEMPEQNRAAVRLVETALKSRHDELLERFVEVYAKTFSMTDLDKLIAFHESAIGRRIAEVGPAIQKEIVEIGDAWHTAAMKSIEGDLAQILSPPAPQPSPQP